MIFREPGFAVAQEVAGAWRPTAATDGENPSSPTRIYICLQNATSASSASGDKPRSTDSWTTMTPDQVIDTCVNQFAAIGGTYDMNGITLTMKTTIAKNPAFMPACELDLLHRKDQRPTMTLTATNEGRIKNPQVMTLTRLD